MSSGAIAPSPVFTGLNNAGSIIAGGWLYIYRAGTLALATTWSDVNLTVPNSNPIQLDGAGRAIIYLGQTSYDFVLKDALLNTIWGPITVPSTTLGQIGGIGEVFMLGGTQLAVVNATAYPSGATFDKLHADSNVWAADSANLPGTYALQVTLQSNDGVNNISVGLVNLSDGSPDTALVTCSSNSATGALVTSVAITFPAGGVVKNYGIKVKVDVALAGPGGQAWGARIVRLT